MKILSTLLSGKRALTRRSSNRNGSEEEFSSSDCRCERRSSAVEKAARCEAERNVTRKPSRFSGATSSARNLLSTRQRGQRQFGLRFMTGLQAFGSSVTERGRGSVVWASRGEFGDSLLRVHIVRTNNARMLHFRNLASIPATDGRSQASLPKKGPSGVAGRPEARGGLKGRRVGFGGIAAAGGGGRQFGRLLAAIEFAEGRGANIPQRQRYALGGLVRLALPGLLVFVRLALVLRTEQRTLDENGVAPNMEEPMALEFSICELRWERYHCSPRLEKCFSVGFIAANRKASSTEPQSKGAGRCRE